MKWIGQNIQDIVSRFRGGVYLEGLGSSSETDILVVDSDGKITTNASAGGGGGGNQIMLIDVGDETTNLTTGVAKKTFRIPHNFNVSEIRVSVNTAPVGSTVIVDINQNGTSILNTKLSIDASEETSYTASTTYGIKNPFLLKDDEITIDIDQIGSDTAGKGLKLLIIGTEITAVTALYHLTASAPTVDEGSAVTFTMHTFGVANSTAIAYVITGIAAGDITESLTGNLTINSNVATQVINAIADMTSESSEVMTMTAQALTAQVTIVNVNPTYSIGRDVATIVEGEAVVFTLTTAGVPNGTTTAYVITGISASDITGNLTGNFTTNSNTAALTVTAVIDGTTEAGGETMTITAGGAVQTCAITDPPTGSPYSRSMYFDGSNDYLEANSYSNGVPTGTVETDFAGFDLITDTNTTPYSLDVEFRIHNDGPSSSNWDMELIGWRADGGNSSGGYYGTWRVNFSVSGNNLFARIWYYKAKFDNGNGNDYDAAGNKYAYLHCSLAITNHFTDSNSPTGNGRWGMWHKFTITRGTSGAISSSNIKMYLNGQEGYGYGAYTGNYSDVPSNKWNGTQHRTIKFGYYGDKVTLGSISLYNKELSLTEINDIYDGGARASGDPDQAEIMNQDPTGKSTNANLVHYYYLDVDGEDGDDDSGTTLQDKKGNDLDLKTMNTDIATITSITIPQVPYFSPASPPAAVYTGESITFTQPSSGSGGVVTWYSDAERTTLVNTGEAYTWTPSSLGAAILYLKDVRNGVTQTAEFAYTVYTAGYSTHSVNARVESLDLYSPTFPLSSFTNGSFSLTFWSAQSTAHNAWLYIMWNDSSNTIMAHGNISQHYWRCRIGASDTYPTGVAKELGSNWMNAWVQWVFSHDVSTGTWKTYVNGALASTYVNVGLETSIGAATNTMRVRIDDRWGKIANIGLYGDVLTDAEAIAIQGGSGGGDVGDTLNLATLSGSSSKLIEYWKINDATFNNNASDVIPGLNGNDIPVANFAASSKSVDRP